MPYIRSLSRINFDVAVASMVTLARRVSRKGYMLDNQLIQAVYRSAIFQASAALEEYIESVLEDWIYLIKNKGKMSKDVPAAIIGCAIYKNNLGAYKKFIAFNDEAAIIKDIVAGLSIFGIIVPDEPVGRFLNPNLLISDKKYPSTKNFRSILSRFGIGNIYKTLEVIGKKDFKKTLQSFSDVRTEIAHQHPSRDLTFNDVEMQLRNLMNLVMYTDRVLYRHIKQCSGKECWRF